MVDLAIESDRDEVVTLTKAKFRKMFSFGYDDAGNKAYGLACRQCKKGWLSPAGSTWFMQGSKGKEVWTMEAARALAEVV